MQKGIGDDIDVNKIAATSDLKPVDCPYRASRLAGNCPEGCEIMLPEQVGSCPCHAGFIQLRIFPANAVS